MSDYSISKQIQSKILGILTSEGKMSGTKRAFEEEQPYRRYSHGCLPYSISHSLEEAFPYHVDDIERKESLRNPVTNNLQHGLPRANSTGHVTDFLLSSFPLRHTLNSDWHSIQTNMISRDLNRRQKNLQERQKLTEEINFLMAHRSSVLMKIKLKGATKNQSALRKGTQNPERLKSREHLSNVEVGKKRGCNLQQDSSENRNTLSIKENSKRTHFSTFSSDEIISDRKWQQRFQELILFKSIHGHCRVPREYESNKSLGLWVAKQRTEYKKGLVGQYSFLTSQRLQKLGEIGFEFNLGTKSDELWRLNYEELIKYKKKHGHCNVPQMYSLNESLGRWVAQQRAQYKRKMDGKSSYITDERIAALTKIGFVWSMRYHADGLLVGGQSFRTSVDN